MSKYEQLFSDVRKELNETRKELDEARKEIKTGKTISHEEVKRRLGL